MNAQRNYYGTLTPLQILTTWLQFRRSSYYALLQRCCERVQRERELLSVTRAVSITKSANLFSFPNFRMDIENYRNCAWVEQERTMFNL
jgi:hypothetical protein